MQANPRSIDALFNSQIRYVVPMFQRLYAWQESPQWATLWDDVVEKASLQLRGIKSNPHYLGALIIEGVRPSSPREVKRFLVIDGQQRLTTLQLLLCAFRDIARQNEWKTLERPVTRYLENADADVMDNPDEEILKLWPTKLNRDIFKSIIMAGSRQAVEKQYPLIRLPRKRSYEPRSNLVEGYLYFSRMIASWVHAVAQEGSKSAEEAAFALLQALQQDFSVVEIALSEGDDSQEIFYSLNSQGRPLSQSDLLRSLIFMRAEKEKADRDAIFEKYWAHFETPFWSQALTRAGREFSRLDMGLRSFLMAKTGQLVDARRVNEEYRRWISSTPPRYASVEDELADFSSYAAIYARYEATDLGSLPSTDLRRVLKDLDVSTALPLLMHLHRDAALDPDQLQACLNTIESFLARRVLLNEENKEYNRLFVEVIQTLGTLRGAEVLPALQRKLIAASSSTRYWPTNDQVVEFLVQTPIVGNVSTPALRLVLERLELFLRSKKTEKESIEAGLQIEHVMPQSWGAHWPLEGKTIPSNIVIYPRYAVDEWEGLESSIRQRNTLVQTLGNLTLLNKYLNPAASNAPWATKLNEYKHSVLRLNREVSNVEDWTEEQITKRSIALAEMICQIWPRPNLPA
jgi:hypothetical protein